MVTFKCNLVVKLTIQKHESTDAYMCTLERENNFDHLFLGQLKRL